MDVDQILVGRWGLFCYLLTAPVGGEGMLIDPGAEAGRLIGRIEQRGVRLRWIVATHGHPDHVGAVAAIKSRTGASFVLHSEEARTLGRWTNRLAVRFMGGRPPPVPDKILHGGEVLQLGSSCVRVLHTPGHCPGAICIYVEGHLFTGDTLFIGSVGRTDLPRASRDELERSLREKILCLPDDTRLWPGHHYGALRSNLLGMEKRKNPFLKAIIGSREGGDFSPLAPERVGGDQKDA